LLLVLHAFTPIQRSHLIVESSIPVNEIAPFFLRVKGIEILSHGCLVLNFTLRDEEFMQADALYEVLFGEEFTYGTTIHISISD